MRQAVSVVVNDTTLDQIEDLQDMLGGTLSKIVRDAIANYHQRMTVEFQSLEEEEVKS